MQVTINVNGAPITREIEPALLLVHFIRDTPGLTGTHWGCDTSNCGACVVQMDGRPVKSCTVLAAMAEGHEIRTIEALEVDGALDPVQQGFHEEHGLQCGFCTPGMVMAAVGLLRAHPNPSEEDIARVMDRSLCRCGTFPRIVKAIKLAAGRSPTAPDAGGPR
jgi:aerobic carbon-monoxide dehydrogenase small subunit